MSKYGKKSEGLFFQHAGSVLRMRRHALKLQFFLSKQMLQADFGARDEAQAKQIDKWKGKPCNRLFQPTTFLYSSVFFSSHSI